MNFPIWILFALAAVVLVLGIGTFIVVRVVQARSRNGLDERTVATPCARDGHAYRAYETGWRCVECGNHVPRIDGEVYGPAEEGLRERRRESR